MDEERVGRTPAEQARLDAALGRYERALLGDDRQEVHAARLVLCRLLEDSGWTVPRDVRDQMARDERALRALAEEAGAAPSDLLRPPSHRTPWVPVVAQASERSRDEEGSG